MENYFNYFTEIEECFRRCRSAQTMAHPRLLLTPIDWALVESWKEGGIPLQAVLTGIERTFQRWGERPRRFQKVNALGFCSQEVLRAADEARTAQIQTGSKSAKTRPAGFSAEELKNFFSSNAQTLERGAARADAKSQAVLRQDLSEITRSLRELAVRPDSGMIDDLEDLERYLTALEEKLAASLTRASSAELLAQFRTEVERGIIPYRGRMSGAQIESLERQFLKKRLFEHYEIPRLSLFYL
jgi:hypothetical protein